MEETPKPTTGPNEELEAMKAVADALTKVDATSARRVLQWASQLFGGETSTRQNQWAHPRHEEPSAPTGDEDPSQDLATLFAEAEPDSGPERALVVAYYQQVIQGAQELDAQAINSELKHLGHGLSNVTNTLSLLINQQPNLIIQTKKMGKGQQARKRYKLTNAGIVKVREMLARAKAATGKEA